MRYGTYNGCRDYNALQQFEKFDLSQYELLPPRPTAFKGKVASVIQTEGNYGLQWNVTMVNSERNQKCSFYIPADATSMLAQQLLLLTTGNLDSSEKTVTNKNGETMTFVDNITKGTVAKTEERTNTLSGSIDEKIINVLTPNSCLSLYDIAKLLGFSKATINKHLKQLQDSNKIESVGVASNTRWKIKS